MKILFKVIGRQKKDSNWQTDLLQIRKKAEEDSERPYFFIIDEINRRNAKDFGRTHDVTRKDKRAIGSKCSIPMNGFLCHKMFTLLARWTPADRSLALWIYALRRRFAFFDFRPAFSSEGFQNYLEEKNAPKLNQLIFSSRNSKWCHCYGQSLGEGFCIGDSYFCRNQDITDSWLQSVIEYEIKHFLLKEYWFDEPSKVRDWGG